MMVPLGSLLDDMASARNALFPELVRTNPDGSTYIECMVPRCREHAVDPQLHCETHLGEARRARQRKLEALDKLTPEQRKARRRLCNIESVARRLANESGRHGDEWRAYVKRATAIIDAPARAKEAKANLDEVF